MFFQTLVFAIVILSIGAIFCLWFEVATRKDKKALDALVAAPEQVAEFWRTGVDGDGYNRLHVKAKSGAVLVIGHFDADEAEKRLLAACGDKLLVPPGFRY